MLPALKDVLRAHEINDITGVLHVGAHFAEEADDYHRLGVPVWWVEAKINDQLVGKVARYAQQTLIEALITEEDDKDYQFHITNNDGMSSSIFDFGEHTLHSPDTVYIEHQWMTSKTLDTIVQENDIKANYLHLDIQGAELRALKGAPKFLREVNYIYTEVSTGHTYKGGAQIQQLDEYLTDFLRVETWMFMHGGTHGDAFYQRIK